MYIYVHTAWKLDKMYSGTGLLRRIAHPRSGGSATAAGALSSKTIARVEFKGLGVLQNKNPRE